MRAVRIMVSYANKIKFFISPTGTKDSNKIKVFSEHVEILY